MVTILVLATKNKNKILEFQEILKDFPIEIRTLSDFGTLPEAIEDGDTFDDNAYKKAIHTAKILGLPSIADDSGLVVEALNGAPGVYSARYAGEGATDSDNVEKLLHDMKGVKNRKAAFQCVLSIAVPSGPALTYEGSCEGVLLEKRCGKSGRVLAAERSLPPLYSHTFPSNSHLNSSPGSLRSRASYSPASPRTPLSVAIHLA